MRILITGNMGYVGGGIVRHLRRQDPEVHLAGLDTGYFAHAVTDPAGVPERRLDVQYFGDVRNPPAGIFDGIDAVVHLAAISNDPMGHAFEKVTFAINRDATMSLAERAKAAGVSRFVFASSCSVYGFADTSYGAGVTEDAPVNPLTAYARSKVEAERGLARIADEGFVVTCLRFATACGMSERLRLDLVLNDFVANAIAAKEIRIMSDGSPWRPLIDVKDMARAVDWAIGRKLSTGGKCLIVNAGSDAWNFQVKDLAAAVADVLGGVKVAINPEGMPDKRSYRVDFRLFRQLAPDHHPQCDLATTIQHLAIGLRRIGFDDREFRRSSYVRLNMLTALRESGELTEDLEWRRRLSE